MECTVGNGYGIVQDTLQSCLSPYYVCSSTFCITEHQAANNKVGFIIHKYLGDDQASSLALSPLASRSIECYYIIMIIV